MKSDKRAVRKLFKKLYEQPKCSFPKPHKRLDAPEKLGVYIIRRDQTILYVGRTLRGKQGLRQRLKNHLYGLSSFARECLNGKGEKLRSGYTYQCLAVKSSRKRALLEAYAIGVLCPEYIGLGE